MVPGGEEARDERCGGWVRGWQQLSLCINPPISLTVSACGVIGHWEWTGGLSGRGLGVHSRGPGESTQATHQAADHAYFHGTFALSYILSFLFLSLGISERSRICCIKCLPPGSLQRSHSSFGGIILGCRLPWKWGLADSHWRGRGPLASPQAHWMISIT